MNTSRNNKSSGFDFGVLLPIAEWLPVYKRKDLVGDMMAGLIVAIMLVPQSMAYAMLAGLPPEIGLYASILPLIIYAMFGSSRVLAVGPVAMVSLLTLTGVGAIAKSGTVEFITLALLLAFMTGVIQLLLGIARLGFLVNYLSHPVLVGFTSAAAIVIGFSQVKHLFGVQVARTEHPYEVFGEILNALPALNPTTLAIGMLSIAVLIYFKWFMSANMRSLKVPESFIGPITKAGALVAVLAGTLAVWLFGLNHSSAVRIVGQIPAGLPPFTLPGIEYSQIASLIPIALIISLVGFTESISIATTLASR